MGKAAFPKHISQERRLLRSSPKQPGALQPGCASVGMRHACWHTQGTAKPRQKPPVVLVPQGGSRMLSQSLPVHMHQSGRGKPPAER